MSKLKSSYHSGSLQVSPWLASSLLSSDEDTSQPRLICLTKGKSCRHCTQLVACMEGITSTNTTSPTIYKRQLKWSSEECSTMTLVSSSSLPLLEKYTLQCRKCGRLESLRSILKFPTMRSRVSLWRAGPTWRIVFCCATPTCGLQLKKSPSGKCSLRYWKTLALLRLVRISFSIRTFCSLISMYLSGDQ